MTQSEKILAYLKSKGPIGATALELTNLYVMQYNWVIKHLREQGHVIDSRLGREENGKLRWRFFYRGQNKARLGSQKHEHNHDGHGHVIVHTDEGKIKKGGVNSPPTPEQTAAHLSAGPPRGQGGYQPIGKSKLNNPPQGGSGVPRQQPIRFTMEG